MRGKATWRERHESSRRITPAYAGKSRAATVTSSSATDHPRVCGEKFATRFESMFRPGSPPRMRGKAQWAPITLLDVRITPAYAGKRTLAVQSSNSHQGSPPRMRGKAWPNSAHNSASGITPAYAGKRLKRSRSTVSHVAIVPLFPSVCNKPVVSDGSPAGRDAPLFLPAENAVPASPAYNLRSL